MWKGAPKHGEGTSYSEQGVGALVRTSSNHASSVKYKDATARLAVGQLYGTEAFGGEVGVAAPRGYAVKVKG